VGYRSPAWSRPGFGPQRPGAAFGCL